MMKLKKADKIEQVVEEEEEETIQIGTLTKAVTVIKYRQYRQLP
jgi:hypothetical protein